MRKVLFPLLTMLFFALTATADSDVSNARALTKRLLPEYAKQFVFKKIAATDDVFSLKSEGGKIVIGGNNANSMAVGLNYYLKYYCLTTISWMKDDPIEMPAVLPKVDKEVKVKARLPMRFFLNYCTFGYTMPWWKWQDWEHFIDWMALNGVNMPLAMTGNEAIWHTVWQRYGLSDEEIRSFFTGPAFLPWHNMCNIDAWQGPLPMSWITAQEALQKKILKRERELNMRPVLPAFNGHIPRALVKKYPNIKASHVGWDTGDDPYACTFLSSEDPMFARIQRDFLQEQRRQYGSDHMYALDPFNEVDPPTLNPDTLGLISKGIYKSLEAVDMDARWIQMTWTFYYKKYWNLERQRAIYQGAPQGKMILLDYWAEHKELWRTNEGFTGQDYIWCCLNNFGGRQQLVAPMDSIYERIDSVCRDGGRGIKGVGCTLEGFDGNVGAYDLTLEKAWDTGRSLSEWRNALADRHVGEVSEAAHKAYEDYFDALRVHFNTYGRTFIESRPSMKYWFRQHGKFGETTPPAYFKLVNLWREMSKIDSKRDAFSLDLVCVGQQTMEDFFYTLWLRYHLAYELRDAKQMRQLSQQMIDVLKDYDRLMSCHRFFSMKKWIDDARACGSTLEEKAYYEADARTLITTWRGFRSSINDYAGRPWTGLIGSFYIPRWQEFLSSTIKAVEDGKPFDEDAYADKLYEWEAKFANGEVPIHYPEAHDALTTSREIIAKYFDNGK